MSRVLGTRGETPAESLRASLRRRGYCLGPTEGAPGGLGSVGLDRCADCGRCGKRVKVTVRGLFSHHKPATPKRRHIAWTRGYATAMASIVRCFHDYDVVRKTMIADGMTLDHFREAGAEIGDIDVLLPVEWRGTSREQARSGR